MNTFFIAGVRHRHIFVSINPTGLRLRVQKDISKDAGWSHEASHDSEYGEQKAEEGVFIRLLGWHLLEKDLVLNL